MSDPLDIAIGAGGGVTVLGLLMGLLKFSGSRNVVALDTSLERLTASIDTLSKDVRDLRDGNAGFELAGDFTGGRWSNVCMEYVAGTGWVEKSRRP